MRRMLLLLPLLGLAACQRYEGPREIYRKNRGGDRSDLKQYAIPEQKVKGRERWSYIEDNAQLYPNGYVDRPGGVGR